MFGLKKEKCLLIFYFIFIFIFFRGGGCKILTLTTRDCDLTLKICVDGGDDLMMLSDEDSSRSRNTTNQTLALHQFKSLIIQIVLQLTKSFVATALPL